MTVQVKVPVLGESVAEATVAKWFKQTGDTVVLDEPLVELETDKVTVEVNSPVAGTLATILVPEGTDVEVNALLGTIEEVKHLLEPVSQSPATATTNRLYAWLEAWTQSSYNDWEKTGRPEL